MQAEVSTFPDIHRASKKTPKNQWPDIEEESGLVHRASVRHPSVAMVLQAAAPASQQQEVPAMRQLCDCRCVILSLPGQLPGVSREHCPAAHFCIIIFTNSS